MRRYMAIASIFLFLSLVHFALTAPVTVRGMHDSEKHVNVVDHDAAKDGAAAWQKRYSLPILTHSSFPDDSESSSPSNPLGPRNGPSPHQTFDSSSPELSGANNAPQSPSSESASAGNPGTPNGNPDNPGTPAQIEDHPSSLLGVDHGSQSPESSIESSADSPRTKNLLAFSSRLGGAGPGPSSLAASTSQFEGSPVPDPSLHLGPTEHDSQTKDYLSILGAGAESDAAGPSRDPHPTEPDTKEILGLFLKDKFLRRVYSPPGP